MNYDYYSLKIELGYVYDLIKSNIYRGWKMPNVLLQMNPNTESHQIINCLIEENNNLCQRIVENKQKVLENPSKEDYLDKLIISTRASSMITNILQKYFDVSMRWPILGEQADSEYIGGRSAKKFIDEVYTPYYYYENMDGRERVIKKAIVKDSRSMQEPGLE